MCGGEMPVVKEETKEEENQQEIDLRLQKEKKIPFSFRLREPRRANVASMRFLIWAGVSQNEVSVCVSVCWFGLFLSWVLSDRKLCCIC
jgi:hypothetical protein